MGKPLPTIACDACGSTNWSILQETCTILKLGDDVLEGSSRVLETYGTAETIRCTRCDRKATKAAQTGVRSTELYARRFPNINDVLNRENTS